MDILPDYFLWICKHTHTHTHIRCSWCCLDFLPPTSAPSWAPTGSELHPLLENHPQQRWSASSSNVWKFLPLPYGSAQLKRLNNSFKSLTSLLQGGQLCGVINGPDLLVRSGEPGPMTLHGFFPCPSLLPSSLMGSTWEHRTNPLHINVPVYCKIHQYRCMYTQRYFQKGAHVYPKHLVICFFHFAVDHRHLWI